MKANELMIGDWVQTPNGCRRVEELSSKNVIMEWHDYGCTVEDVLPIPLTDEILDANGYVREGGVSKWFDRNHFVSVLHWNENRHEVQIYTKGSKRLYDVMIEVHYVHELQHALRLCGIEKEIEL